ncbi:DNA methyltransferase [Enterobacter asburiae]
MVSIINPKQVVSSTINKEKRLFPYYAGYSNEFAESVLDSLDLPQGSLILDPWNGSGTTCVVSYKKGYKGVGIDLNPVMVLVSKASFVSKLDVKSLCPLANGVLKNNLSRSSVSCENDELCKWFTQDTVCYLRGIEIRINKLFVNESNYCDLTDPFNLDQVTPLAAFFYVILFRVTRRLVVDFIGTNPTWIKSPKLDSARKSVSKNDINKLFLEEVKILSNHETLLCTPDPSPISLVLGDSRSLDIESETVDAIITSPPYCTRIDYAVSTSLELAVLRMSSEQYDKLRRSLIGTSTVSKVVNEPLECWGKTCLDFLEDVRNHPSRASGTYYFKNHVQYFDSLFTSLSELKRVCKVGAKLVIVVQNSHYKNIYNDLALIVQEMFGSLNIGMQERYDFNSKRSMSTLNSRSRKYIEHRKNIESVLVFKK